MRQLRLNHSDVEIANRYHISRERVRQVLGNRGEKLKTRNIKLLVSNQDALCAALYLSHSLTVEQIATRYGVLANTVKRSLPTLATYLAERGLHHCGCCNCDLPLDRFGIRNGRPLASVCKDCNILRSRCGFRSCEVRAMTPAERQYHLNHKGPQGRKRS